MGIKKTICRNEAFDHRCLRSIAHVFVEPMSEFRHKLLDKGDHLVDKVVDLHQLSWLGHVLHMNYYYLH